jgi:hypothetical protein
VFLFESLPVANELANQPIEFYCPVRNEMILMDFEDQQQE